MTVRLLMERTDRTYFRLAGILRDNMHRTRGETLSVLNGDYDLETSTAAPRSVEEPHTLGSDARSSKHGHQRGKMASNL